MPLDPIWFATIAFVPPADSTEHGASDARS